MSVEDTTDALGKMQILAGPVEVTTQTDRVPSENEDEKDKIPATTEGASTEDKEVDVDAIKLFVGQIPRTMNKDELIPMLKEFGDIYNISIIKHRITNEHAGCAFVKFYTRAAADRAIAALHDKRVLPGMKNAMQVKPAHGEFQCKLFVGMIPHTCTASEIEAIFARFGDIEELNLLKRRSKHLNKGCAFIQYKFKHQALKAIEELHGKHIIEGSNMPLVVKFADTRKSKRSPRGMGRGHWRGNPTQHHSNSMGGRGYHGRGNFPYASHYFPNPMSAYQPQPQPQPHGGNRWHGGGYGRGWPPVYFDATAYYGSPNPNGMFYNSQMQYVPMASPYGSTSPVHRGTSSEGAAAAASPTASPSSPTANASTNTSFDT